MPDSQSEFEKGQRVRQMDHGRGMARLRDILSVGTVKKVNPKSCMVEFDKVWSPQGMVKCVPHTRSIPKDCLERIEFR